MAPHEPVSRYRLNASEDNADVRIKRQIFGRETVVAITEGALYSVQRSNFSSEGAMDVASRDIFLQTPIYSRIRCPPENGGLIV